MLGGSNTTPHPTPPPAMGAFRQLFLVDETLDAFAHGIVDQRTAFVELSSFEGSVEEFTDVLHMLDVLHQEPSCKSVLMLTENDSRCGVGTYFRNGCRKNACLQTMEAIVVRTIPDQDFVDRRLHSAALQFIV